MIEHGKLRTCQVIGQKPTKCSRSQLVDNSNFVEELKKKLLVRKIQFLAILQA